MVAPILARHRPEVPYAAARVGTGSEVLGFDDDRSQDHDWGLRLSVFVADDGTAADVRDLLERELPPTFDGRPTRFALTSDPATVHRVGVGTVDAFVRSRLGVGVGQLAADPRAWMVLSGQSVLEVVAGAVFTDPVGELTAARRALRWYPDDVWRYVVAAGWGRLAQELPFVGRTADVGDDLGSRIIAARLVRDLVHLAFLVERTWPPYPKWLGTAFRRLDVAAAMSPALERALVADGGAAREQALVDVVAVLHEAQASAGLPAPGPATVPFHDRPYRTVDPGVAAAVRATIVDPVVAALPPGIGSVEQWVDNVDVLASPDRRAALLRWPG